MYRRLVLMYASTGQSTLVHLHPRHNLIIQVALITTECASILLLYKLITPVLLSFVLVPDIHELCCFSRFEN